MPDARQRAYLSAMGIPLWEPRAASPSPSSVAAREGETVAREQAPAVAFPSANDQPLEGDSPPSAMDWEPLQQAVSACRACGLCESRTQTVFGVGDREARLMIVGEAPGVDEDRRGEPFVGRAGQLLTAMLAAIGLKREQVYIANVLKCRPPGNRDPLRDEVEACRAYLDRQIALIQPTLILSLGGVSARHLLRTEDPVGRLRGRQHHYAETGTTVRVTYHPAYLLRRPEEKAKAWSDLQLVWCDLHGVQSH